MKAVLSQQFSDYLWLTTTTTSSSTTTGEEAPITLWDVLKILNERDDDNKLYFELTAQLEDSYYSLPMYTHTHASLSTQ